MIKILFTYPLKVANEAQRLEELMVDYDYLHIRKPDYSQEKMEELLDALSPELLSRSVIHSHYYLVGRYELRGVNLNERVLPHVFDIHDTGSCEIQTLIRSGNQILINRQAVDAVTYSSHAVDEIQQLEIETDYVFLSPVFDSISKKGYSSQFKDVDGLKKALKTVKKKVIALGGIQGDLHQEMLEEYGFDGYAELGSVWKNELIED